MSKLQYLTITQFAGLSRNVDPRRIRPNTNTEGVADAVICDNFTTTKSKALIVAPGYVKVSEGTGTGGIKNLLNYEKDLDTRYLIITKGDTHYYITVDNDTWVSLGSYGTEAAIVGGTVYKGTSSKRYAILGNDDDSNFIIKTDITSTSNISEASIKGGYIMAEFLGHLFVAKDASTYYSGTEDETSWGSTGSGDAGVIGYNNIVTGIQPDAKHITVLVSDEQEGVEFQFDDSYNLVIPRKVFKRAYGCIAPKSVQGVGANIYYLSDRGVMALGAEERFYENGVPRPNSLSEDIEPILDEINFSARGKIVSANWQEKQEYWLAVPTGNSTIPDATLIYSQDIKGWYTRSGFYVGDMELFRNDKLKHDLYFGDANSPVIYKFDDDVYDYDGQGYKRTWKSKTFTMGAPFMTKKHYRIDIAGGMFTGTEFFITLEVDSRKKKYKIDNSFIITNSYGDYIGDDYLGDAYFGGGAVEEDGFKRFYAPLDFSSEIREGVELTITIENDGAGQAFKLDYLGILYEILPQKQTPRRNYVNTQVTT